MSRPKEMPISCCMREPMETAHPLGYDTHAVDARPKVRRRSTAAHWCAVCFVGGWEAWPIDKCSNKEDVCRRERETPTLEKTDRRKDSE